MEVVKQDSKKKLYHSLALRCIFLQTLTKVKGMKDKTKQLQEKSYTNVLSFILG